MEEVEILIESIEFAASDAQVIKQTLSCYRLLPCAAYCVFR